MSTEKGPMIARGRTAEIFLWKDNQVLKLFLEGFPATRVECEVQTTRAIHKSGLPVPAVKGIMEVDGRLGIIFERIEGSSMLRELTSKPWKLFRLARLLAELQAAMHSCEVPELPSLRGRLEERIRAVAALPAKTKEATLKALAELPDGSAVCQGDFHPDNIIMSSKGPIIIDWPDASQGNPLADVARTCLLLRLGEPLPGTPRRWLINWLRGLFHSIYLRSYVQLRAASREQIAVWQLPVAAARLTENILEEKIQLLALIEASLRYRNS